MSKRFFDSMMDDMDYINYYRWCSSQSVTNFGAPANMYPNQYDIFNRGCYFPPYTLVPNTSKKNREAYYLFKRNEDRNFFPNNFYFGNHFKGPGYHSNRRFEDNRKLPRSSSFDLVSRSNSRRQFSNWSGSPGQPYNDNQDENWFMKRQNRGFSKDNSIQSSATHLDNKQNKFEYSDKAKKDEMILTAQLGFHRSSPSLTNDRTTNQNLDNSTKGYSKNNTQLSMNSTTMVSPKPGSEYDTWFSADEQQQIVNVLKDVNYRHERQLWRDMQSTKTDQMSLDNSTVSSVDADSSDWQYGSFSSDEDDGITILVSPTEYPLNDVMDSDMHLSISSDDLIEKSTSDYFEEFQNIFTTSPEKNIINTLVKECFKEQTISKITNGEASVERKVESVSDKSNNNEISVEVASSGRNSSEEIKENESSIASPKELNHAASTKTYSEKLRRLSPDKPLPRCFESLVMPSVIESTKGQSDGLEVTKFEPVLNAVTGEHADALRLTYLEKIQRSSPAMQMSPNFEPNKGPSASAAAKEKSVPVLSGSSGAPKTFVIPKYKQVIEMKQISMPTKLQMSSSCDQIVLTDYHLRKIQKQKYDFDCKFKNACDPFNHNSQLQNKFPVSQVWKSIRSVYDSSQPSVHNINDYRNFIFHNNPNKNFNRLSRIPNQFFQTYEHRERGYRQVFDVPSEKGRVPPSKDSRVSSPRMPETGNVVKSDTCLLRNYGLPESDYEKSSKSESHLQGKSSKDLDRLYKRISLEELFSSAEQDKPVRPPNTMMHIPPFRSDANSSLISDSFVSPTDHLKRILKIGTSGTQVPAADSVVNFQVPFPNRVEKTRVSTGCQTEATEDRCWRKEASQKVLNSKETSARKVLAEGNGNKKVTVDGCGSDCKDELKSDSHVVNGRINIESQGLPNLSNKSQSDDIISTYANRNGDHPNDVSQKDEEKGGHKRGGRRKGKPNRSKPKGEVKTDMEISCCEKCRKNIDIMNFSEKEMQFDVLKQSNDADANGMKQPISVKALEDPLKRQHDLDRKELERDKIKVKAVLPESMKSKPNVADDVVEKGSYRAKRQRPRSMYKDVFKEFSRPKDNSIALSNGRTGSLPYVANKKNDSEIKDHGSRSFDMCSVNKSSFNTSPHFKREYNSLLRYKTPRFRRQFRKFEAQNVSKDEETVKTQQINEDIQRESSLEFSSMHQGDGTRKGDCPSKFQSDTNLEKDEKDQNIQDGSHLHGKFNSLVMPQLQKKSEASSTLTGQDTCSEKLQNPEITSFHVKSLHDDSVYTSALSMKPLMKPAFSKPNGICEKPPSLDSTKCLPITKERFVHNANAPIHEKWNVLPSPKEVVKSKSEIVSTG